MAKKEERFHAILHLQFSISLKPDRSLAASGFINSVGRLGERPFLMAAAETRM